MNVRLSYMFYQFTQFNQLKASQNIYLTFLYYFLSVAKTEKFHKIKLLRNIFANFFESSLNNLHSRLV